MIPSIAIFSSDMAIGRYVAQRAGIGINAGRIRGINSKIRGGEVAHTGVIPFLKKFEATVRCCTQNGIRGGSQLLFTFQSGTKK
jgi:ribonucleoside-diphosphate reductase alpha chain